MSTAVEALELQLKEGAPNDGQLAAPDAESDGGEDDDEYETAD